MTSELEQAKKKILKKSKDRQRLLINEGFDLYCVKLSKDGMDEVGDLALQEGIKIGRKFEAEEIFKEFDNLAKGWSDKKNELIQMKLDDLLKWKQKHLNQKEGGSK